MTELFTLTVYGTPRPAGSKKAFPIKSKGQFTGRTVVTDANKNSKPWKDSIARDAAKAMDNRPLFNGPLIVEFTFFVARPKGHFGKRGLSPSAPPFPAVKPDVLKLARAVEDALSGIVYRDDAQIVAETLLKEYGEPERVEITVRSAMPPVVAPRNAAQLAAL
jgi:Holliday junction resolvase RusA-like endonuclease